MDIDYENLRWLLDIDEERLTRAAETSEWEAERAPASHGIDIESSTDATASSESRAIHQSASSFARAGVYRMLLDVERAMDLFERATLLYRRIGRGFANVTSVCSGKHFELEEWLDLAPTRDRADAAVHLLVGAAFFEAVTGRSSRTSDELLASFSSKERDVSPFGRLGVPVDSYVAFFRAAKSAARVIQLADIEKIPQQEGSEVGVVPARPTAAERERQTVDALSSALVGYLLRADEPIAAAMTDRYHWARLKGRLLPVEPESVAVATVANAAVLRLGGGAPDILASEITEQLPPRARVPMILGQGIAQAMLVT